MSKWLDRLTRQTDKHNPRKRKQYKKARYRKKAEAFKKWCDAEEAKAEELGRLHPDWMSEVNEWLEKREVE